MECNLSLEIPVEPAQAYSAAHLPTALRGAVVDWLPALGEPGQLLVPVPAAAAALWLLMVSPSPLSRYALGSGLGEGYLVAAQAHGGAA